MKFLMSKKLCIPKNPHDVNKELVKKPVLPRSIYELLGTSDKFRDEYYEMYLAKCEEFKIKGKKIHDANVIALSNNRPKLGEVYKLKLQDVKLDENNTENEENKEKIKSEIKLNSVTSSSSLGSIKETGVLLRKRHERYYKDVWDTNEKHCYFEPWFRRYLVLCRFISAVRKTIQKYRMLKRLAVLKELKYNKELIPFYESQYIKIEQLSYPNVFEKFLAQ